MQRKSQGNFIVYFLVSFGVLFALAYAIGWVPTFIKSENGKSFGVLWDEVQKTSNQTNNQALNFRSGEEPNRIVIPKIGVDVVVANPESTSISTLDEYLKNGAVRYPGSSLLGEGGLLIFGHSTGFRVVNNQAYKAFNGLKDLKAGDKIEVYGPTKVFEYQVDSVTLMSADRALVKLGGAENVLTLSTCNSFGDKDDRYVVSASFLGQR